MRYFVTGIDTDSGKTLASAILCEALDADYWKPIQAGFPKDSDTVRQLISNSKTQIVPERFVLNTPASPHAAAKVDGVRIRLGDFTIPTSENLIVEGAGGCLVPINDDEFVVDLIKQLDLKTILVADLYLGSINHTLLTFEALHSRNIDVAGLIFNGPTNAESERIILKHSGARKLLHIRKEAQLDKATVIRYARELKQAF